MREVKYMLLGRIRQRASVLGLLLGVWLLHYIDFKIFMVPVLVMVIILFLPQPRLFASWISRIFGGLMLTTVFLQIAATIQFIILPDSGYRTIAAITVILTGLLVLFAPEIKRPRRWITKNDVFALMLALFFLLPFTPLAMGRHTIEHIAQIGTTQAVDGPHHYGLMAMVNFYEHFTYKDVYYPEGFHIAMSFMGNTVTQSQADFSWESNAMLYFSQYLVLGTMLAFALYYLCLRWIQLLQNTEDDIASKYKVAIVLCAGPILALLYLLPFISEGFLNYYYVCTLLVLALLMLSELRFARAKKDKQAELTVAQDATFRWSVAVYLLLVFGATSSWTLLMPPFILLLILLVAPDNLHPKQIFKQWVTKRNTPLLLLMALQLVPILLQLKYLSGSGDALNYTGTLRQFHPFIILSGLLTVLYVMFTKRINEQAKKLISHIFMVLFFFTGSLIALQYFVVGEVRYYVLKCLLLVEMLIVMAAIAVILDFCKSRTMLTVKTIAMLAVSVPFALLLLIGTVENPLKDVRDLFRNYSNTEKPLFLNRDSEVYIDLAKKEKVNNFNATILHYNKEKDSYFAHMQVPLWANMLQYSAQYPDIRASNCFDMITNTLGEGAETRTQKKALGKIIIECANMAHKRGQNFYIITDADSAGKVRALAGDHAVVVY